MNDSEISSYISRLVTKGLNLVSEDHRPDFREYFKLHHHKLSEISGYSLWPGFQAETAKFAFKNFAPNKGDVLIASYPRTGTTWTLSIVQHLLYKDERKLCETLKSLSYFYLYLEFGPVSKYEVVENLPFPRRTFATHLPAELVNLKKFAKIIYVIRNPKDQLVSWFCFVKKHRFLQYCSLLRLLQDCNLEEFIDLFIAEYYDALRAKYIYAHNKAFAKPCEGYLEHVRGWYRHKPTKNILFLVYEEMIKNPLKEIRRIAEFLGVSLDDDFVNKVAEMTSFEQMFADKESYNTKLRKGQNGDWKNHVTVQQSELIDAKVEEILGQTNVTFIYE